MTVVSLVKPVDHIKGFIINVMNEMQLIGRLKEHNNFFQVIFITEYMSSGSLKQFLKRTKRNVKKLPLQAWKRWCTQILSALR